MPDGKAPSLALPKSSETVEVTRAQPEIVRVTADLSAAGILVLADTDYPGWQASVDGKPASILRANGFFRGVALTAGRHQVEFVFRPKSVLVGGLLSLIALAITGIGLIVGNPARARRPARVKEERR